MLIAMLKRGAKRFLGFLPIAAFLFVSLRPGLPSRAQADGPHDGFSLRFPLLMANYSPGTISGHVIDASDRSDLANASVCTSPTRCAQTDSSGIYSITADSGPRILTAYAGGHYNVTQQVMAKGGQTVTLNFALSPYLTGGDVDRRMVLTWYANPYWCTPGVSECENDLDAHLWLQAQLPVHIGFDPMNPAWRGDCTVYPYSCLEVDTRKGFGPETIAIASFEPLTTYYYGVLNYNQGQPGVPPISETGAHVELYDQNGSLMSFDVPQTGTGNFWYVFNYTRSSGDWVVTPVNCIALYDADIENIKAQCP
jgi:hypothetical protein